MNGPLSLPGGVADFRSRVMAATNWPNETILDDRVAGIVDEWKRNRQELRRAAVLVSVVERAGEAHMVLTQRMEGLRSHSGQVAFPGGKIDETDASPEAAALREAHEEIG